MHVLESMQYENLMKDKTIIRFIQAQARAAYSKSNRNSGMEVDDFVSIGFEILYKAMNTYSDAHNTKFNSYFTTLLKRDMYKAYLKTHRKKRGGAGSKEDDIRFARKDAVERWSDPENSPKPILHISLSEPRTKSDESDTMFLQIMSECDNEPEYELLLIQVRKQLPAELRLVFKQMTDPDDKLLATAAARSAGKTKCVITNTMVAIHLDLSMADLKARIESIQRIIAGVLGIDIERWTAMCAERDRRNLGLQDC